MNVISENRICPETLCPEARNGKKYPSRVTFRPDESISDYEWFSHSERRNPDTPCLVERWKKPSTDALLDNPESPWDNRNTNIYRDHCTYRGSDESGYFRRKDRIVSVAGFMLDFDSHTNDDMPLPAIKEILESEDFQTAVPCNRIIMTGNGYQVHIAYYKSIEADEQERMHHIRDYEAIIQSVMKYCEEVWNLRPDQACKDINRLHRHYPSFNTKRMTHLNDDKNRIPVELIMERVVDDGAVAEFIDKASIKYPCAVPPVRQANIYIADAVGDMNDALIRVCEPPCFKQVWKNGSSEGHRNAERFAILARFHSCGINENDALDLASQFNDRCNPPDDDTAVSSHVRHFYADPKQVGCTYMYNTCGTCPFDSKPLEDAKKECPFISRITTKKVNHPYFIGDNGNIMRKEYSQTPEGATEEIHLPVTQEGHLIVTSVIQDKDGKLYRGKIVNGSWHIPFEVPASLWASRLKFAETFKGLAGEKLMFLGKNTEHLAMASEYLCSEKEIKVVRDFGWNDDFTSFFAVACVIDKNGIHPAKNEYFRCDHNAAQKLKLAIPNSDKQVQDTLIHIKDELMQFNNYEVMQYVIGTTFCAPFVSLFRKRATTTNAAPSIIIQGTTGSGKSALLILAACFFGVVRDSDVMSFSSTPRVVNDLGHWFKDSIYMIDDLKWSALSKSVQTQVTQILQSYVDGQGRSRLCNKGADGFEPETGKEIRGLVAIAAEDLPSGEASIFGRFMIINMGETVTNTELYGKCLAESKNYSAVMSSFLEWFLSKGNSRDELLELFDKYRLKLEKDVPRERINLIRVCSQLALNMVGYEMFIRFAVNKKTFSIEEAKTLLADHQSRLRTLRDLRLSQISSETPVEKFLSMIVSLVASGKVLIGSDNDSHKPVIGFQEYDAQLDKDILYLDPQIAYGQVQRAFDDLQERIPFNQYSLGQQLQSRGYIARTDKDRLTYSKVHDGKKGRYYAIDLTKFEWNVSDDDDNEIFEIPFDSGNLENDSDQTAFTLSSEENDNEL